MSRLFRFRFSSDGALDNHSFGNLFLTAMASVTGDFAEAVRLTSEVLAIKGVIFPATNSNVQLCAELADGSFVQGETRISSAGQRIHRVQLHPPDALPLKDALDAIAAADLITIGPGSLYTSLIPNMLIKEVMHAVKASPAVKVYVQNIMTQPGETDGYSAVDHVQALADHCGGILFSNVLINNRLPSAEMLKRYEVEHATLVEVDHLRLRSMGLKIVEHDLLAEDGVIRHDPDRLAKAVFEMLPKGEPRT
jgi:uncharacterized cofD-like protein